MTAEDRDRLHRRWGALLTVLAALALGITLGFFLNRAAAAGNPAPAVTKVFFQPRATATVTITPVPVVSGNG
jgi:hypothetical protein